jgi:hypothetical protein
MTNNLWEIIKFDDLVLLLKNAENKFLVLSIITEDTDNKTKRIIKLFMKDKAKIYSKVTFLFYQAKKKDFGKLMPMFDKKMDKYPKMFHIWDIKKIITEVFSIDNREILESSLHEKIDGMEPFENLHDLYLNGIHQTQHKNNEDDDNTDDDSEQKSDTFSTNNSFNENDEKINQNNKQQYNPILQQTHNYPPPKKFIDPEIEKKKYIEKISLLRQEQEKSINDFLIECKKRKEYEEGILKKNKKK